MFHSEKKSLGGAAEWARGDHRDEIGWIFGDSIVTTGSPSPAFSAWYALHKYNKYPRDGGWLDQPLSLLAQIEAIDLVVSTYRFIGQEKADWTKLNATQRAIITEFEK